MGIAFDSDRALEDMTQDKLEFADIAKRLASSTIETSKGDGMVIGLEGSWGSGKTSLLNFLRSELAASQDEEIHTVTIAPWLDGDKSSMVNSLLERMMPILEAKEKAIPEAGGLEKNGGEEKIIEIGQLLKDYGSKTARKVASVANVAGILLPDAKMVAAVLDGVANVLDELTPAESTLSELKQKITEKIKKLDTRFVVIIDDLDRLEPEQAVEVMRLVRSVADFPRVTYLMCYDRKILADALKTGLKVSDGDLFLQKIVQLTFDIPLPEPFALRNHFRDEAKIIHAEVMMADADDEFFDDLYSAVDQQGIRLSTPREVKLSLNRIRFIFPQVKDNVYFPDLCRLELIRITNFNLYQWLEEYLLAYSVLKVEKDATVVNNDKLKMGKRLEELLPPRNPDSSEFDLSISNLAEFVPGLKYDEKPEDLVFDMQDRDADYEITRHKRLGSPHHYRFYFALTGPKSVMPDKKFYDLLEFARTNTDRLIERLTEEVNKDYGSRKTWFEHILDRLDQRCIADLDEDQLAGIVIALSEMMDSAMAKDDRKRKSSYSIDRNASRISRVCLKRLKELNQQKQVETVRQMARKGKAVNWLVGSFFRTQLFQHGLVGDQATKPDQWEISEEDLDEVIIILKARVGKETVKLSIPDMPRISIYLYGWMEITGDEKQVIDWVKEYSTTDKRFLNILNHLRQWTMINGAVYYPLSKEAVERFFDWDVVQARLTELKDDESVDQDQVAELQLAIKQSMGNYSGSQSWLFSDV